MIQVGIQENIVLENAFINDDGNLVVSTKKQTEGDDPLAIFNSTSTEMVSNQTADTIYWPIKIDDIVKTAEDASRRINTLKIGLNEILLGYFSPEEITWDVLKDTGITVDNKDKKLTQDATLRLIYKNITEQFVKMLKKADMTRKFRVKYVRQSVMKHYAKLPTYPPFWESMEVSSDLSRLAYTNYETSRGLDNPNPAQPDQNTLDQQSAEIDEVFGKEMN